MKVYYSDTPFVPAPDISDRIFLAGPTPRDTQTSSWRPAALEILKQNKYDGMVYVPERECGWTEDFSYEDQADWENDALLDASCIVFWVPRNLKTLPGFTTNVEFGRFAHKWNVLYGRPENSPKNKYLDWYYRKYSNNNYPIFGALEPLIVAAIEVSQRWCLNEWEWEAAK